MPVAELTCSIAAPRYVIQSSGCGGSRWGEDHGLQNRRREGAPDFHVWRHQESLGAGDAVSFPPKSRLVDYLTNTGPTYIAREGVVCMVDYLRSEDDPDRYTPSATCVPFRSSLADAQTSAEDVVFMMDGYRRALLLASRIIEAGLTSELRQEVTDLLDADEAHMLRNSPGRMPWDGNGGS